MKNETLNLIEGFFLEHKDLCSVRVDILKATELLVNTFKNGGKLLVCGNGGSSADSDHIVGELMKGFVKKRPLNDELVVRAKKMYGDEGEALTKNLQQGLPAISLTCQTALMTAFLNDCDPQYLYAQQVNALMKKGDVLLAISTSGNAKNVAHATKIAKVLGGQVIGLTGSTGGTLAQLADITIISPKSETYKIQEHHLPIYHLLCLIIESELF